MKVKARMKMCNTNNASENVNETNEIRIEPVNEHVPLARVYNADIKKWIKDPVNGQREARNLLQKHGLLIFKNCGLSPQDEVDFTKLFGYHKEDEDENAGNGFEKIKLFKHLVIWEMLDEKLHENE